MNVVLQYTVDDDNVENIIENIVDKGIITSVGSHLDRSDIIKALSSTDTKSTGTTLSIVASNSINYNMNNDSVLMTTNSSNCDCSIDLPVLVDTPNPNSVVYTPITPPATATTTAATRWINTTKSNRILDRFKSKQCKIRLPKIQSFTLQKTDDDNHNNLDDNHTMNHVINDTITENDTNDNKYIKNVMSEIQNETIPYENKIDATAENDENQNNKNNDKRNNNTNNCMKLCADNNSKNTNTNTNNDNRKQRWLSQSKQRLLNELQVTLVQEGLCNNTNSTTNDENVYCKDTIDKEIEKMQSTKTTITKGVTEHEVSSSTSIEQQNDSNNFNANNIDHSELIRNNENRNESINSKNNSSRNSSSCNKTSSLDRSSSRSSTTPTTNNNSNNNKMTTTNKKKKVQQQQQQQQQRMNAIQWRGRSRIRAKFRNIVSTAAAKAFGTTVSSTTTAVAWGTVQVSSTTTEQAQTTLSSSPNPSPSPSPSPVEKQSSSSTSSSSSMSSEEIALRTNSPLHALSPELNHISITVNTQESEIWCDTRSSSASTSSSSTCTSDVVKMIQGIGFGDTCKEANTTTIPPQILQCSRYGCMKEFCQPVVGKQNVNCTTTDLQDDQPHPTLVVGPCTFHTAPPIIQYNQKYIYWACCPHRQVQNLCDLMLIDGCETKPYCTTDDKQFAKEIIQYEKKNSTTRTGNTNPLRQKNKNLQQQEEQHTRKRQHRNQHGVKRKCQLSKSSSSSSSSIEADLDVVILSRSLSEYDKHHKTSMSLEFIDSCDECESSPKTSTLNASQNTNTNNSTSPSPSNEKKCPITLVEFKKVLHSFGIDSTLYDSIVDDIGCEYGPLELSNEQLTIAIKKKLGSILHDGFQTFSKRKQRQQQLQQVSSQMSVQQQSFIPIDDLRTIDDKQSHCSSFSSNKYGKDKYSDFYQGQNSECIEIALSNDNKDDTDSSVKSFKTSDFYTTQILVQAMEDPILSSPNSLYGKLFGDSDILCSEDDNDTRNSTSNDLHLSTKSNDEIKSSTSTNKTHTSTIKLVRKISKPILVDDINMWDDEYSLSKNQRRRHNYRRRHQSGLRALATTAASVLKRFNSTTSNIRYKNSHYSTVDDCSSRYNDTINDTYQDTYQPKQEQQREGQQQQHSAPSLRVINNNQNNDRSSSLMYCLSKDENDIKINSTTECSIMDTGTKDNDGIVVTEWYKYESKFPIPDDWLSLLDDSYDTVTNNGTTTTPSYRRQILIQYLSVFLFGCCIPNTKYMDDNKN